LAFRIVSDYSLAVPTAFSSTPSRSAPLALNCSERPALCDWRAWFQSAYRSGRSPHWIKVNNPASPAGHNSEGSRLIEPDKGIQMDNDVLMQILNELREIKTDLRWFKEREDLKHQAIRKATEKAAGGLANVDPHIEKVLTRIGPEH
jgi:hypothetical protein